MLTDVKTAYTKQSIFLGADMVAPSDMMDGRIGAIRKVKNIVSCIEIDILMMHFCSRH